MLAVDRAGGSHDPCAVAAVGVRAERERQTMVDAFDLLNPDRRIQQPVCVLVWSAAGSDNQAGWRSKLGERSDGGAVVAIDPDDGGALDQVATTAAATSARDDTDEHIGARR
jgi:hypothetical protein